MKSISLTKILFGFLIATTFTNVYAEDDFSLTPEQIEVLKKANELNPIEPWNPKKIWSSIINDDGTFDYGDKVPKIPEVQSIPQKTINHTKVKQSNPPLAKITPVVTPPRKNVVVKNSEPSKILMPTQIKKSTTPLVVATVKKIDMPKPTISKNNIK
jgi:hypothetical protein